MGERGDRAVAATQRNRRARVIVDAAMRIIPAAREPEVISREGNDIFRRCRAVIGDDVNVKGRVVVDRANFGAKFVHLTRDVDRHRVIFAFSRGEPYLNFFVFFYPRDRARGHHHVVHLDQPKCTQIVPRDSNHVARCRHLVPREVCNARALVRDKEGFAQAIRAQLGATPLATLFDLQNVGRVGALAFGHVALQCLAPLVGRADRDGFNSCVISGGVIRAGFASDGDLHGLRAKVAPLDGDPCATFGAKAMRRRRDGRQIGSIVRVSVE